MSAAATDREEMAEHAEDAFLFENDGSRLFALLHSPRPDSALLARDGGRRGVVVCHPFAEEKAVAHRVLTDFARALCRRGYYVLRFDCRGCGDSEGDSHDVSLGSQLEDIGSAIEEIGARVGVLRPSLFGLRLGATLAALRAAEDERVDSLVLWEPIVDTRSYLNKMLRLQAMANREFGSPAITREDLIRDMRATGTVDVVGYGLSARCFDELSTLDLPARVGTYEGDALIMAIQKRERKRRELQVLVRAYLKSGARADFENVLEQTFWNDPGNPFRELASWRGHEKLFDRSIDWLDARQGRIEAG